MSQCGWESANGYMWGKSLLGPETSMVGFLLLDAMQLDLGKEVDQPACQHEQTEL